MLRLSELYEKEVQYQMIAQHKNQTKDSVDVDESEDVGYPLTVAVEEQEEKEQLLEEGFSTWSKKDFNSFIRACEKYGRNDVKGNASKMEVKTKEEVERYGEVFKERYKDLNDNERIIKNIESGEARIFHKDEVIRTLGWN
ncbi:hypothetical protein AgCh_022959 [Apium graveolens]